MLPPYFFMTFVQFVCFFLLSSLCDFAKNYFPKFRYWFALTREIIRDCRPRWKLYSEEQNRLNSLSPELMSTVALVLSIG